MTSWWRQRIFGKEWRRRAPRASHLFWLLGLAVTTALTPTPGESSTQSRLYYARGLVPFAQGNWEAAYQLFDQAARADPADVEALYYRGVAAARLGQWNVAIRDIESAVALRSDLRGAALDLGIIHFELQQFDEAERWLARAYERPHDRFTAALFLGLNRYRRGDNPGAREFLADAEKDPKLRPTARYYTALTLLREQQDGAARQLLGEVSRAHPGSEVGEVAARYLAGGTASARDAAERRWSAHGSVGFEYDTNVPLAADDSDIQKTRSIGDESDGRARLSAGGRYRVWDDDSVQVGLGYDFYQSIHFDLTDFDLQGHRARLDLVMPRGRFRAGVTGLYDFYALDYRSYFQEGSGIPWLAFFFDETNATQIYYALRGRDYFRDPFEPYLDSINNAVGVRQLIGIGGTDRILRVGYRFDDNNPPSKDGDDFQFQGHQLDVELALPVPHLVDAELGYAFRLEDYESGNSRSPDGFRRHDHSHQFAVRLEREVFSHWFATFAYVGALHGSNLPEFEYDRHVVSGGVEYRF